MSFRNEADFGASFLLLQSGRSRRADLTLGDFEPGRPAGQRINGVKLMAMRFESWERANQRIEAGRVEDLRVRLDLPLAGLGSALSFRRRLKPGEFEFDARVSGGVYRTSPDTPPLENISARLEVTGNRLVVHELKMSREGSALPVIDLDVDGMHRLMRLPPDERRAPRGPGEPIPGLAAAARALVRPGRDAREPLVVELSDLYLGHPALVLPFRDAEAELRFPDGKLRVQARGIYGGAPAELEILYDPQARHVRADVRYLDGDAPPRSDTGDLWLSAKLGVPALQLGRWRLEDIQVNVAAQGALVSFDGGRAVFGGGDTELRGTVALGAGSHALVDFHTRTTNADLDAVNEPLRLRPGALAGRADFNGLWRGRLEPGQDFLDHADLAIDLHATKGAIAHLPASVALARVPSLQGIRGLFGRPLPYDEINARFLVRDGILRAESLSLSGPELRLLAAGELDLVAPERPADLLLAFMFLQTVDKMIELVPIIGSWVLGEDDNLVTIYVRVKGPWASPSASLVPPQSVRTAAGWAERMIGAGVAQLRKILSIPPKKKEAPDVPKDTSELARPG